ncbi:hypothetical protein P7K49_019720 [Saguinus oedipus]|uniref:Uncharacterized protein n=1 Tax=Saguinus oedipus TaxID=9490 RepID=A0ABQ9UZY6_SAGOE|nr:hypothetical protein P7K49_019720 [Saguinus oedipus]
MASSLTDISGKPPKPGASQEEGSVPRDITLLRGEPVSKAARVKHQRECLGRPTDMVEGHVQPKGKLIPFYPREFPRAKLWEWEGRVAWAGPVRSLLSSGMFPPLQKMPPLSRQTLILPRKLRPPDEETSDPSQSASPQETTTAARETSAAVQGTAKVTSNSQGLNRLNEQGNITHDFEEQKKQSDLLPDPSPGQAHGLLLFNVPEVIGSKLSFQSGFSPEPLLQSAPNVSQKGNQSRLLCTENRHAGAPAKLLH